MRIDYPVPFYSNTVDNTHCFQAAFRMVLTYFLPQQEFTWEYLEKITAKEPDLWTWPLAGMIWLQDNGFEVISTEIFDYQEFIDTGEKYLVKFYGQEVADKQIKYSNLTQEQKYAQKLLQKNILKRTLPTIETIQNFLQQEYVLICNLNSQKLNGKTGYEGHSVVIKGIDNDMLILHDPGLPPQENRKVTSSLFESAWAFPDKNAKNIIAIKLKH